MISSAYNYDTHPPLWLSDCQGALLTGKETIPSLVSSFSESQLLREPRKKQNVYSNVPASWFCRGGCPNRNHSPSAADYFQGLEVAVVGCQECGCHAIIIREIQITLGGLLQEFQVTVARCLVIAGSHFFCQQGLGQVSLSGQG